MSLSSVRVSVLVDALSAHRYSVPELVLVVVFRGYATPQLGRLKPAFGVVKAEIYISTGGSITYWFPPAAAGGRWCTSTIHRRQLH